MIAVLIPTLGRPEKLASLVENVRDVAEVPTTIYFVVELDDQATCETLWNLPGDQVAVFGKFGSCAKAFNAGYHASVEPYVFTGNDDLRFHKGWDTAALEQDAQVVGTNDGNGRMTCFSLVARSYIEEFSGVYDKANTLCHEYASQYVDTELAEYAKARGVWGEAPDSLTEHLHHEFGKADRNHPNYVKARSTCADDHQTYERRRAAWTAHLASASPAPLVSSAPTS